MHKRNVMNTNLHFLISLRIMVIKPELLINNVCEFCIFLRSHWSITSLVSDERV